MGEHGLGLERCGSLNICVSRGTQFLQLNNGLRAYACATEWCWAGQWGHHDQGWGKGPRTSLLVVISEAIIVKEEEVDEQEEGLLEWYAVLRKDAP